MVAHDHDHVFPCVKDSVTKQNQYIYGWSYDMDSKHRDFTMNALYLEIFGKTPLLIDPTGRGIEDANSGELYPVNPEEFVKNDLGGKFRLYRLLEKKDYNCGITALDMANTGIIMFLQQIETVWADRQDRDKFTEAIKKASTFFSKLQSKLFKDIQNPGLQIIALQNAYTEVLQQIEANINDFKKCSSSPSSSLTSTQSEEDTVRVKFRDVFESYWWSYFLCWAQKPEIQILLGHLRANASINVQIRLMINLLSSQNGLFNTMQEACESTLEFLLSQTPTTLNSDAHMLVYKLSQILLKPVPLPWAKELFGRIPLPDLIDYRQWQDTREELVPNLFPKIDMGSLFP